MPGLAIAVDSLLPLVGPIDHLQETAEQRRRAGEKAGANPGVAEAEAVV
jgi:hypothetical protein